MTILRQRPSPQVPRTHPFTLVLSGVSEITDALEKALFDAGCDDALVASRDGFVYLDFDREAASLQEAIQSAIADVTAAGYAVARLEPDDLVTVAEIARRTGRSRERVRQLLLGPGGSPPPVANPRGRSPLWRWSEVAQWLVDRAQMDVAPPLPREDSRTIAAFNAALDLLRQVRDEGAALDLVRRVAGASRVTPKGVGEKGSGVK